MRSSVEVQKSCLPYMNVSLKKNNGRAAGIPWITFTHHAIFPCAIRETFPLKSSFSDMRLQFVNKFSHVSVLTLWSVLTFSNSKRMALIGEKSSKSNYERLPLMMFIS